MSPRERRGPPRDDPGPRAPGHDPSPSSHDRGYAPGPDPLPVRLYRRALAILPAGFRRAWGDAMVAMFAEAWRERRGAGRAALVLRAAVDLPGTALAARTHGLVRAATTELGADLRAAVRSLRVAPLFTVAATLSLALGVGGVATVYAVADRLLLRPLGGLDDPATLVEVTPGTFSWPMVQELDEGMTSLTGLAAHDTRTVALDPGSADPRPVDAGVVAGHFFDVLGVGAVRGRTLVPSDDVPGATPVAVLSHALWTEMGAPDDVLSRDLRVNGAPLRIVGVAPPAFTGLRLWRRPAFWMPIEAWPSVSLGRTPDVHSRGWGWLESVGRLGAGVSLETARAEAAAVASRIATVHPVQRSELDEVDVVPARTQAAALVGDALRPLLAALAGGVALALLAAAANVANLLLARATRRGRELGIRAALGADRFRLGRLVAVETVVLVALGLGGGLLLSVLALRGLGGVRLPEGLSFEGASLHPDLRLLGLTAGVLALVTVVAGLAPALSAAGTGPAALGSGRAPTAGRASHRLRAAFVALQVTVGVVLLSGTLVFGRSLVEALRVDLGFDPEGLAVVQLDASLFHDDRAGATVAVEELVTALRGQPGSPAVSWSSVAPLTTDEEGETFDIAGRTWPERRPSVEVNAVGPDFFRAAGIELVRGDASAVEGTVDVPVAVISEAMARLYWPGDDPVGATLLIMDRELRVVAVAGDTRFHGFASEPAPMVFGVFPQLLGPSVNLVLGGRSAEPLLGTVAELTRSVDPRLVVAGAASGPDLRNLLVAPQRMGGVVFGLFAVLAVALALTGVWGVVACAVGARSREFGVRLSLGAEPGRVTAEVLRRNLAPVVGGVALGTLASVALTRAASGLLFGVAGTDPLPTTAAAVLILGMALVATWLPARRAGRVAPVRVLAVE